MKKCIVFMLLCMSFVVSVLSVDVRLGEIGEKKMRHGDQTRIKKRKVADIINLFKRLRLVHSVSMPIHSN